MHAIFAFVYCARYYTCRSLVQALYLYLDLYHLPPPGMDATAFFIETHINNPNPYNFSKEFVIPCRPRGVPSLEMEPSKDLASREDQLLGEAC